MIMDETETTILMTKMIQTMKMHSKHIVVMDEWPSLT